MKVLHIGSGNLYGGVEKVLLTLARLRDIHPGLEQHFAVCFEGRFADELEQSGAPVYHLKAMRGRDALAIFKNRDALSSLQRELGLSAVVYHSLWSYDLLGLGAARSSARRVLWLHDAVQRIGPLEFCARLQRPDLVLSNSMFTAGTVSLLYPGARAGVVYCPVEFETGTRNSEKRAALRRQLGTPADDVVVVQASRMEAWKGHRLLLDAVGRLRDLPGWTLWIAGGAQRPEEQTYLHSLKAQAETLGIATKVRFLGQRNDVRDLLAVADIHCQPNLGAEPFGITFIEAMMAQLPVVTCRLGAASEIVDESCGIICEPGDVGDLASALRRLIGQPETRKRLGQAGPARARLISDPAARIEDLFRYLSDPAQTDMEQTAAPVPASKGAF